jgi:serine/threonine-protein kinase
MRCPTCQAINTDTAQFCVDCGTRLTPTSEPANPISGGQPTVLQGRYVLTDKLGQGGMGAVYRASDTRLGTATWAIKEMTTGAITSPLEEQQARDAFRREAEMLAGLTHANLPRVVDHFEEHGKVYLVMEFVAGQSLYAYLHARGLPRALPEVLGWINPLCDVLEYLHNQVPPIIFRDLKPANIMLMPDGRLKLIDFGIARFFTPGKARDTLAYGTIGYSAPEQYGKGQTDARADIYSLGVLMHQLLTGHDPTTTPFRLPPTTGLRPDLSPALADLITNATHTDPQQRPPDIATFRRLLQQATSQQPVRQTAAVANVSAVNVPRFQPVGVPVQQLPTSEPGLIVLDTKEQAETTTMANLGRWVGIIGLFGMCAATVLGFFGLAMDGQDSPFFSAAALLVFPSFFVGLLGAVFGIIALLNPTTVQTAKGRRHAIIGIITGFSVLIVCCVFTLLTGSMLPPTEGS